VGDLIPQQGPLSGIHAGLSVMRNPRGIFVACDMPWLKAEFLRYLAGLAPECDIVVPRLEGQVEGMHAVYSRNCREPIESCLRSGRRKLISFYEACSVRYVEREECERFDPTMRMFMNVNTMEEWREAMRDER
jgi:molybdopterin-guanine dinucleotide biosynthesis protein A